MRCLSDGLGGGLLRYVLGVAVGVWGRWLLIFPFCEFLLERNVIFLGGLDLDRKLLNKNDSLV